MDMLAAYAGQVRNGMPVLLEEISLPESASIIITVLDEQMAIKTKAQRQR